MGRKHLGGSSTLKADHRNEEYNDTLESVFDTAMANLDSKHKNKRRVRRMKLPNLLSLCFKSAADDVINTSAAPTDADMSTTFKETTQSLSPSSSSPRTSSNVNDNDEDAIFILEDGTMGQRGHYSSKQRGTVRSTLRRVAYSIQKTVASAGVSTNRHSANEFYDIY
mmetsp:Transcript_21096/g.34924  ORF Transcript_21096/g.34924 Transcript_21096/m.34924 type:complete len:167 (+) Transcript_21096:108-608(+)|eukprot:CAMPEP_0119010064 /NCGR_PEP_ID=MMETSP1176-20130426/4769_1 /TAXON_ID=265551 /ORGANISM="Synedropsis recta cf, Strain CCMP1620" /LENGTH=166 /DNA_ID=CAMNT_0006962665 /DNA_START=83 /DNA_END=583 /DNA_ORIENTATION=-